MPQPPESLWTTAGDLFPAVHKAAQWQTANAYWLKPQPGRLRLEDAEVTELPVPLLRWTHDSIDAELCFREDVGDGKESVFKMLDGLMRGINCSLFFAAITQERDTNTTRENKLGGAYIRQRTANAWHGHPNCRRDKRAYTKDTTHENGW